jgi:hypothetical protein
MRTSTSSHPARTIRVADEVWIAVALLHREHPRQLDFSIEEIVDRAAKENLAGTTRPSVYAHIVSHCVANRLPSPNRCMMLFETAPGRRRLFRQGDPYNAARGGSKITPAIADIPGDYQILLSWYQDWSRQQNDGEQTPDPLLSLAASGSQLWENEPGDDFVRRLREGWE